MIELHEVQDFDAYALTADAAKHERRAPAKLRFHEITLRTPEEARIDEMKAAGAGALAFAANDPHVERPVYDPLAANMRILTACIGSRLVAVAGSGDESVTIKLEKDDKTSVFLSFEGWDGGLIVGEEKSLDA